MAGIAHRETAPLFNHDGTVTIPLTQGFVAIIDAADFKIVAGRAWFAHRHPDGNWYAMQGRRIEGRQTMRYMHRVILGITDPKVEVDHQNGDTLLNRRHNLRPASRSQNARNSKIRADNKTGYRGVQLFRATGKFQAYGRLNGKMYHLGFFTDPVEAARSRDAFTKKHYGEFGRLNFPNA